jgi:Tol biopolymer transport system component
MELFVMDADGSNVRQITNNGAANFAPFFHPDGRRIIFSSNLHDPTGRNFDLYIINIDGTGLERVTYFEGFDGFPMFTRDGKKLVFCSNRNARKPGDTNIFIADWVEEEPPQHQPPPSSKDSPVHPRQP